MKDFRTAELFEIYKNLLTEKQQQVLSDYLIYDLSLGEIAENTGTTRQSVNDAVKKATRQLEKYDSALKLKSLTDNLKVLADECERQGNADIAKRIRDLFGE